jgi:hypothetical protein
MSPERDVAFFKDRRFNALRWLKSLSRYAGLMVGSSKQCLLKGTLRFLKIEGLTRCAG